MLSDSFKRFISPPARTLNFIWLALLVAPFMYAVVAWFVSSGAEAKEGDFGTLRLAFGALAVATIAGSYVYRRWALSDAVLEERLADPPAAAMSGSEGLAPAEQGLASLFPYYQTTTIIVLTARESAAVLGLVLTIITGDIWLYVPFGLAAAATMASQPPAVGAFMEGALPLARRGV